MKQALKIILLLLAVFPLWLTIMAMGNESRLDAIKARLNEEFLKIKDRHIQVVEIQSRVKELDEIDLTSKWEVEISDLNPQGSSRIVLKSLDANQRLLKIVRLPLKLFIEEPVAVATRDLTRGELIAREDFKVEWKDASQFRSPVPHALELANQIVRSNIKEGEVVYSNQIQKDTMVARGDRVKVRVVGTGITLTVVGQALEAGGRGQTIKVVNIDSKKEFLGVVTDSKEVEVRL